MHIEPGILSAGKILAANAAAVATLGSHAGGFLRRPLDLVKTLLAAVFFSIFMQMWHMSVGPSELHLIGASTIYFTFGFLPTLFGFALGLLLQSALFEPQDLIHLGVNSLSLMVPLIAAHAAVGRVCFRDGGAAGDIAKLKWATVFKFDGIYYSGVVAMVGFWLALGNEATPFTDWGLFALSYLPLALCEPAISLGLLRLLARFRDTGLIRRFTALDRLEFA
ncbi:energy-coupling factor ABC transporter permease [Aquabacter sp. CN5-332]|uniref:energy-coupling factor ABC transporter permease n=1 Tax=Aquabacter sp. CN5-332 TaxID=3156608 RepID=UPI0032B52FDC